MDNLNDIFWNSTPEEMMNGYKSIENNNAYICLICGELFEKGIIYTYDEVMVEAEKAAKIHIAKSHGAVFNYLINMNKRYTSLSDTQKELFELFYSGLEDKEIAQHLEISSSTVRNHRFKFKEKEKQAKVFLALMKLLEKGEREECFMTIHKGASMIDDRYMITKSEKDKILANYIKNGRACVFPGKEKKKIVILGYIAQKFDAKKVYEEKEVNEIIKTVIDDFATVRRYLIQYGFMERKRDGSEYWIKN